MNDDHFADLREGYDRLAPEYTTRIADELAHKPFDRELLDRFASETRGKGTVLDAGCGPGHVAQYLHKRGVTVSGLDLSAGMIEHARALHPGVDFAQGSMVELSAESALAGIVALYSIIHIPRDEQSAMFTSWQRALRPGGLILVAFHLGETDRHIEELWGHHVSLDFLFFTREEIEKRLVDAGLSNVESHEREPYPDIEVETRRAYILAQHDHG